ncbi:MAG: NYN domain-containing protein [Cyanobacteria bacterium P01_A01_bin.114]
MASSTAEAILLVDGYNVVGAWPELIRLRDQLGLEPARNQLAEDLANYSAFKAFETWLVFDAYGQQQPHRQESVTNHLSIHYTSFGQTADSYIERACALFRKDSRKFQTRLIVATSDRAQQLTVVGYGAEWISAQQLGSDVHFSRQHVKRRQKPAKQSKKRFLADSLNPEAQAKLARLRQGLWD